MSQIEFDTDGFDEFSELISEYMDRAGEKETLELLKVGADALKNDALRLPKPYSEIHAAGYTHLVNTFYSEINNSKKEVEVGWGKYYGPMVEHGTRKMRARAHLYPLYQSNADRYTKLMLEKFYN